MAASSTQGALRGGILAGLISLMMQLHVLRFNFYAGAPWREMLMQFVAAI